MYAILLDLRMYCFAENLSTVLSTMEPDVNYSSPMSLSMIVIYCRDLLDFVWFSQKCAYSTTLKVFFC